MRIAVTGISAITPLGNNFWEHVSKGVFCGTKIESFRDGPSKFIRIAEEAVRLAAEDARLRKKEIAEAGITMSSSKGGTIYKDVVYMPNLIRCNGPALNVISACATGLCSVIMGCNIIKTRRADVVITGGADSCTGGFIHSAFRRLGVISDDGVCRPFSGNRTGFVLSEGACALVLEEASHAKRRGAVPYGEITGWASLCGAYHITCPEPGGESIAKLIHICTRGRTGRIDYINAHGTGTVQNDRAETNGLRRAFGKRAYDIPISSTKAVSGHMLAASGVFELIIGLMAVKYNFIPPTANLSEPDADCDLDYTPNTGRARKVDRFITLSYGFGGHLSCVEAKRYEVHN